jgi:hypothetical protein
MGLKGGGQAADTFADAGVETAVLLAGRAILLDARLDGHRVGRPVPVHRNSSSRVRNNFAGRPVCRAHYAAEIAVT